MAHGIAAILVGSDCEVMQRIGCQLRIALCLDTFGQLEGANSVLRIGKRLKLAVGDPLSGKTRRSFRCSQKVLMGLAALAGQKQAADRLLSSLQVDCRSTCDALDWTPPFTSDEGLRRTVTTAM